MRVWLSQLLRRPRTLIGSKRSAWGLMTVLLLCHEDNKMWPDWYKISSDLGCGKVKASLGCEAGYYHHSAQYYQSRENTVIETKTLEVRPDVHEEWESHLRRSPRLRSARWRSKSASSGPEAVRSVSALETVKMCVNVSTCWLQSRTCPQYSQLRTVLISLMLQISMFWSPNWSDNETVSVRGLWLTDNISTFPHITSLFPCQTENCRIICHCISSVTYLQLSIIHHPPPAMQGPQSEY